MLSAASRRWSGISGLVPFYGAFGLREMHGYLLTRNNISWQYWLQLIILLLIGLNNFQELNSPKALSQKGEKIRSYWSDKDRSRD